MPIYDYRCDECGVFDQMHTVAARDLPAQCPQYGMAGARIPNGLPMLLRHVDGQPVSDESAYLVRHLAGCLCWGPTVFSAIRDGAQSQQWCGE